MGPKHIGVTTMTFHGHVTSSITWPFDSPYAIYCWWSIGTEFLSPTVFEIRTNERTNKPTNKQTRRIVIPHAAVSSTFSVSLLALILCRTRTSHFTCSRTRTLAIWRWRINVRVREHPTFLNPSIIFPVYIQQSLPSIMCPNKRAP